FTSPYLHGVPVIDFPIRLLTRAADRWRQRSRAEPSRGRASGSQFRIEPLEPRLLLNGDTLQVMTVDALIDAQQSSDPIVLYVGPTGDPAAPFTSGVMDFE